MHGRPPLRLLLLCGVAASALLLSQAQASSEELPALQPVPSFYSAWVQGYGFWQKDGGFGPFIPVFGPLADMPGLGGAVGLEVRPLSLSPWTFGVNLQIGGTRRKKQTFSTSSVVPPSSTPVTATLTQSRKAEHLILDFMVGRDMGLGLSRTGEPLLQLQAGLRYARLKENERIDLGYATSGAAFAREFVNFDRGFSGIGPRLAMVGSYPLTGAISLEGQVGVAFLYGRSTLKISTGGTISGSPVPFGTGFSEHRNGWVPSIDASLGVSYTFNPHARVTLGYKAQAFYNAFKTQTLSPNEDTDFIFHGPFVEGRLAF